MEKFCGRGAVGCADASESRSCGKNIRKGILQWMVGGDGVTRLPCSTRGASPPPTLPDPFTHSRPAEPNPYQRPLCALALIPAQAGSEWMRACV